MLGIANPLALAPGSTRHASKVSAPVLRTPLPIDTTVTTGTARTTTLRVTACQVSRALGTHDPKSWQRVYHNLLF